MVAELKTEVELLKRDIAMISRLVEKFDTTIEKLQQVANDITKIVSLQEQKIQIQDRINVDVDKTLERQQQEHNSDMKDLHKKINEVNRELTDKLDNSSSVILKELQAVKEELNSKIKALEAWRYMVMGVISFVVFIVSQATGIAKLFFP